MLVFSRRIFIAFFLTILLTDARSAVNPPDTLLNTNSKDTILLRRFVERQYLCYDDYSGLDSLLDNLQRYFPKASLGNPGTALTALLLPEQTIGAGFHYWPNHFEYYLFTKQNVEYYRTRNPYTNVYLASGTKEEQYFRARHTQNITKQLNMAVGFTKLRSQGDFLRQAGNHTNAFLSSNYLSRNGKYFLLGNIVYNNLRIQENGGIANDSTFEEAGFADKSLIAVNLESAQRRIWNKGVYLKQGLTYGNTDQPEADSLKPQFISKGYFSHSISAEDNSLLFLDTDPDPEFYESILRDSAETRDSVYYWKIENELAWAMNSKPGILCKPKLKLSVTHQWVRFKQFEVDSAMQNIIGSAEHNGAVKRLSWQASGEYAISGAQRGDMHSLARVKFLLRDTAAYLELINSFSRKNPEFIFNRYISNHYDWNYDWNKYGISVTNLVFSSSKLKLAAGVSAVYYDDPLYFDINARPRQYAGSFTAYSAFVKKNFRVGKWVFANTVRYQHIPDSTVIRFPAIVSENAIYYENSLFNGALGIQAGIDIFYTSSFMGNTYSPVTGQYYIQNEKRIGNYPYADVFVNLKIKTVKAFLKYEHANAGLLGNTYYLVPHYPLFDASFVIGISWDFFN